MGSAALAASVRISAGAGGSTMTGGGGGGGDGAGAAPQEAERAPPAEELHHVQAHRARFAGRRGRRRLGRTRERIG